MVLKAISGHAGDAAILAAEQEAKATGEVRRAIEKELDEARYSATLAERHYELVDSAKRHVVRELEARWNAALERVAALERRLLGCDEEAAARPSIDRDALISLALDLPRAWNAPGTDARALSN